MDMNVIPHPALSDPLQRALVEAIQGGLPLVARPYAAIGRQVGLSEREVIQRIGDLVDQGVIKRLGVVVRHRELGYDANAMVVWDIPDERVGELGQLPRQFYLCHPMLSTSASPAGLAIQPVHDDPWARPR